MASPADELSGNLLRDTLERRRDTAALIAEQGRAVALWRAPGLVSDGAGGFVPGPGDPEPQNAVQRFYSASLYEPLEQGTAQRGNDLAEKFILIGTYDDDIRPDDWFFIGGKKAVVDWIHADRTYQVKAEGTIVDDGS